MPLQCSVLLFFDVLNFLRNKGMCFTFYHFTASSNAGIWLGMIVALLLLFLLKIRSRLLLSGNVFEKGPTQAESHEIHRHLRNHRYDWFGNQEVGNEPYEWNDINAGTACWGCTIDLGNTYSSLLRKCDCHSKRLAVN